MKEYLILCDSLPYLVIKAESYEHALSYVNEKYDFTDVSEYITIVEK